MKFPTEWKHEKCSKARTSRGRLVLFNSQGNGIVCFSILQPSVKFVMFGFFSRVKSLQHHLTILCHLSPGSWPVRLGIMAKLWYPARNLQATSLIKVSMYMIVYVCIPYIMPSCWTFMAPLSTQPRFDGDQTIGARAPAWYSCSISNFWCISCSIVFWSCRAPNGSRHWVIMGETELFTRHLEASRHLGTGVQKQRVKKCPRHSKPIPQVFIHPTRGPTSIQVGRESMVDRIVSIYSYTTYW